MLTDLVSEAFALDTDVRVAPLMLGVGESLEIAVTRDAPDVLILGASAPAESPGATDEACSLLYGHPRLIVLGLVADGRSAWLCQLLPAVRPLGEASAASLQDAVHEALARRHR
jgi:hypothetical protein